MASLMSGLSARAAVVAPASRVAMPQSTSAPVRFGFSVEAAHKKGTGSTKNGRDSNPKYLGVKKYGGEPVATGTACDDGDGATADDVCNGAGTCTGKLYNGSDLVATLAITTTSSTATLDTNYTAVSENAALTLVVSLNASATDVVFAVEYTQ